MIHKSDVTVGWYITTPIHSYTCITRVYQENYVKMIIIFIAKTIMVYTYQYNTASPLIKIMCSFDLFACVRKSIFDRLTVTDFVLGGICSVCKFNISILCLDIFYY